MLLAAQALMNARLLRHESAAHGDEISYESKAAFLVDHGRFPPVPNAERARPLPPQFFGNTDWRPYGWPLVLAALHAGTPPPHSLQRARVFVFQFAEVAFLSALLFATANRMWGTDGAALRACILGASPWLFAFVTSMVPDTTAAVLAGLGLVLLATTLSRRERRGWATAGAALCLSATFLLRAEFLALAPLFVAALLLPGVADRRARLASALIAGVVFGGALASQVLYRISVASHAEIFGPARFVNMGGFRWVHTWFNTEAQSYDQFVYLLTEGSARVEDLPARAFANDDERRQIAGAVRLAAERGYTRETDSTFADVARARERAHPLVNVVGTRLSRTAQMWLNTQVGSAWLDLLTPFPRTLVRWPLFGALLVWKGALLMAATWGFTASARRLAGGAVQEADVLTSLFGAWVLARTALIGVVLGWGVHRYMLAAWPGVLWCAMAGVHSARARRFSLTAPSVAT